MTPKAPKPGQKKKDQANNRRLRIRVKERTLEFSPVITIQEKFAVRAATGLPYESFQVQNLTQFGEDCLCVYWWLARRQNGEPNLPFEVVAQEWPAVLDVADIDLEEYDPDTDGDTDAPGESAGG